MIQLTNYTLQCFTLLLMLLFDKDDLKCIFLALNSQISKANDQPMAFLWDKVTWNQLKFEKKIFSGVWVKLKYFINILLKYNLWDCSNKRWINSNFFLVILWINNKSIEIRKQSFSKVFLPFCFLAISVH